MFTFVSQLVDALLVNGLILLLFVYVLAYPIAWLSGFIDTPGISHLIYLLHCVALGFIGHAFFVNVSASEVASPFAASCLYWVSGGVGWLMAIFPFAIFDDDCNPFETGVGRAVASAAGIIGFVSHSTISGIVTLELTRFMMS